MGLLCLQVATARQLAWKFWTFETAQNLEEDFQEKTSQQLWTLSQLNLPDRRKCHDNCYKEYVTLRKREIMLTHKERPFLRACVSFLSQVSSCQLSWHTTPPTVAPVSNSEKERRVEFNFSFKFHAIGKGREYDIFQDQVSNRSPGLLITVCSTLI